MVCTCSLTISAIRRISLTVCVKSRCGDTERAGSVSLELMVLVYFHANLFYILFYLFMS